MGRGWKRARKLGTAPVPYPTAVVQSAETELTDQDLCRHNGQRAEDANLDSTDRIAGDQVSADEGDVRLVLVESGGLAATAVVCVSGSVGLAERPLSSSSWIGSVSPTGTGVVIWRRIWTAESRSAGWGSENLNVMEESFAINLDSNLRANKGTCPGNPLHCPEYWPCFQREWSGSPANLDSSDVRPTSSRRL